MNTQRTTVWMTAALLLAAMAMPVLAQDDRDNRPPPPRADDNRGGGDSDRLPPPRRPDGPPRPAAVPVGEAPGPQVHAMMGYLQLVEQYKRLTQDPTAAGVAAVVTAADILRPRGPQATAEYFEKLLPKVTNPTIQNAIRLQLADLYRASNNPDKALEHLNALITAPDSTPAEKKHE